MVCYSCPSSTAHPFSGEIARILNSDFPPVLMEFSVVQTARHACEVQFNATRMETLAKYLKKLLSREDVANVLSQLCQLVTECVRLGLPLKNVVFDVNQVFYDPWSCRIRFMYLPLDNIVPDASAVRAFFEQVASNMRPADASAAALHEAYCRYFQGASSFNPVELATYLDALLAGERATCERAADEGAVATQADGMHEPPGRPEESVPVVRPTARIMSMLGKREKANWEPKKVVAPVGRSVLDGREIHDRPLSSQVVDDARAAGGAQATGDVQVVGRHGRVDPGTSVLDAVDFSMTESPFDSSTEVLPVEESKDASEQDTTVLDSLVPEEQVRFVLTRRRTGESFEVSGRHYVVGKSKHSSYQVKGTTTVSRSHAWFCCDGGDCWMEDDQSLNGTFVNEEKLEPHLRVKLEDGCVVRMSDEEFVFNVVRVGQE